ncbi:N-6 DNA methylase [Nodosilinea sp. LEGE 07298]|uniref:HsdM family class I SAM-dependent methyltransferase n=1 Tax=Nodosilinea sp. LEGE 07298 TaxID=2777970 RepID=UPI0018814232|nr:N-6 DNA methylase [Nodosilinea sp. LEGE 07298]MBE9112114.1 N-6 DNA methylase [Nodosilinea sp. LEGE 07298]
MNEQLEALYKETCKPLGYKELEVGQVGQENTQAAVCWGTKDGAPTQRVMLAVVPEAYFDDQAADKVLTLSYELGQPEPVAAVVSDGKETRYFELNPAAPYELDQLPEASLINDIFRLRVEQTFKWSQKVYHKLQKGFDDFHEQVYSSVRDTVDGKNDIIDETAKFIFLELFRLRHPEAEKTFEYKNQTLTLDEVFKPERFEQGSKEDKKESVDQVRTAFDALKGHKDYVTTDEEGQPYPIFTEQDHLKLSNPQNYATLIHLLQDLGNLEDNNGQPIRENGNPVKGTLAHMSGDVLGRSFDVFLRHKFQKEGIGIYLTPYPVKRAMVDMVLHDIANDLESFGRLIERDADGKPAFKVCDPTGGSGGFLVTLLPPLRLLLENSNLSDKEFEQLWTDMLEHSFYAADSSPRMVRLARLNMALQGANRANIYNIGDSLTTDLFQPNSFDLILTNPPFGTPKSAKEEEAARLAKFRTDIEFEDEKKQPKGILKPTTSGLAMGATPDKKGVWKPKDKGVDLSVLFVDRCLQLLKPGGRLLMVVPDSILCNANTRYLREYLMGKKDEKTNQFNGGKAIVKAVVSLPSDAFKLAGTGAKTSILYVQKRKSKKDDETQFVAETQGSVFMAVADALGYSVKQNQEVPDQPNDLVPIMGAYRRGE